MDAIEARARQIAEKFRWGTTSDEMILPKVLDWHAIWAREEARYPSQGQVVGKRRVIRNFYELGGVLFCNAENGAGAWYTDLDEWRHYAEMTSKN